MPCQRQLVPSGCVVSHVHASAPPPLQLCGRGAPLPSAALPLTSGRATLPAAAAASGTSAMAPGRGSLASTSTGTITCVVTWGCLGVGKTASQPVQIQTAQAAAREHWQQQRQRRHVSMGVGMPILSCCAVGVYISVQLRGRGVGWARLPQQRMPAFPPNSGTAHSHRVAGDTCRLNGREGRRQARLQPSPDKGPAGWPHLLQAAQRAAALLVRAGRQVAHEDRVGRGDVLEGHAHGQLGAQLLVKDLQECRQMAGNGLRACPRPASCSQALQARHQNACMQA